MVKDPMKCYMTTDHPNTGPFTRYPTIMSWLMSKKARDEKMATLRKWVSEEATLGSCRERTNAASISLR